MRLITYILLTILAASSVAWSQSDHGIDCYFGGGISFLSGPQTLNDENTIGFNVNGGMGFGFHILPSVSLIFNIDYTAFPKDEAQARKETLQQMPDSAKLGAGISIGDGGTLSIFTVTANLKYLASHESQLAPYIIVGAGFFSTAVTDVHASYVHSSQGQSSIVESTYHPLVLSRTKFNVLSAMTVSAGAGVDMPISKTNSVFIEGRYVIGYTSFGNTTYIPVKLGIRLGI